MEVKGTAIATIPVFVREKFAEDGYDKWFQGLSTQAKAVFEVPVLPSHWYPLIPIFAEPTELICNLFYNGDVRGAWECGRFSADYALKGIYKMFVKIGSADFLLKKAGQIITTYYQPSKIEIIREKDVYIDIRILEFPDMVEVVEARIAGWIERALEISGCKEVNLQIAKSLTKNDPCTELRASWK